MDTVDVQAGPCGSGRCMPNRFTMMPFVSGGKPRLLVNRRRYVKHFLRRKAYVVGPYVVVVKKENK